MFRLATPITSARPVSDFDDISTILTHSSLTGSKKSAPWQQHIGEDGHVFYVELTHSNLVPILGPRKTDASSVCSLCSTRSCHSCASEDTGYSSDPDAHSTQSRPRKSDNAVLDLSHESLPLPWKVADLDEDDDGVSVDLLDFERGDGELGERLNHKCNVGSGSNKSSTDNRLSSRGRHHRCLACTRTSSLCERHSNKLSVPRNPLLKSDFSGDHSQTCRCGGQPSPLLPRQHKTLDASREIVLHLRPSGHAWDAHSKVSWLEAMLGIVPGVPGHPDAAKSGGSQSQHLKPDTSLSEKVVVVGLVPDGPALKSKELFIGDQICSINGKQVTWSNLSTVLSSLHQTRKVRLQVCWPDTSSSLSSSSTSPASGDRLLLDTGSVLNVLQDKAGAHVPPSTSSQGHRGALDGVCVLYMSMEGVSSDDTGGKDDDVVYQFPKEDSVLSRLRGSFFTLDHLLTRTTDTDIRMLTVSVDDSLINVACRKEGKDVLIITAPAKRLPSSQLLTVMQSVLRLLNLLFGTVEEAFCAGRHHRALDDIMSFLFASSLQASLKGDTIVQSSLKGYMDYLPLPDDVMVSISCTLTEYESADFADMSESFYGCRRAFTVLGSMMFYKGRVTCSHLCPEDGNDVGLYLQHSGLLALSAQRSLHQLLVWREIFPTRLCHEVAGINNVFGYSEPHARWYLMVVGVKNTLLACVLEAGGCSTRFDGVRLPDPFYVDQARAALVQLQTAEVISACEIRLSGDGLPATTTADKLLAHYSMLESTHRGLDNFIKNTASLALSLNNSHHHANGLVALSNTTVLPANGLTPRGGRREWRKSSIESDGSSGSYGSHEGHNKSPRGKGRLFPPPPERMEVLKPSFVIDSDVNTCKLSCGKENALLVYCQVNEQEGVLITSPAVSDDKAASCSLQQQVVENFHRCVARIHADFNRVRPKSHAEEGLLDRIHGDRSLKSCREEGVLFTCTLGDRTDSKKSLNSLVYWVIGRKFRNLHSREVYVCFHESTPQNVIELAFRLSLGSLSST